MSRGGISVEVGYVHVTVFTLTLIRSNQILRPFENVLCQLVSRVCTHIHHCHHFLLVGESVQSYGLRCWVVFVLLSPRSGSVSKISLTRSPT